MRMPLSDPSWRALVSVLQLRGCNIHVSLCRHVLTQSAHLLSKPAVPSALGWGETNQMLPLASEEFTGAVEILEPHSWGSNPGPSSRSWGTLDRLSNLTVPQFPHV